MIAKDATRRERVLTTTQPIIIILLIGLTLRRLRPLRLRLPSNNTPATLESIPRLGPLLVLLSLTPLTRRRTPSRSTSAAFPGRTEQFAYLQEIRLERIDIAFRLAMLTRCADGD